MSLILDLPPELEAELTAEANQLNLPLSDYVLRVLATGRIAGSKPTSGADLVAYWQKAGVVGSRPDIIDAPQHARQLRERAEKRERS